MKNKCDYCKEESNCRRARMMSIDPNTLDTTEVNICEFCDIIISEPIERAVPKIANILSKRIEKNDNRTS